MKFLILSLLCIAAPICAQNNNGNTGANVPGKSDESQQTPGDPKQGAQSSYNFDGGLYPGFKAFSPDGKKIWTSKQIDSNNYQIRIWDSLNGALINTLDIDERIRRIEWNPNSNEIIVGAVTKSTLWKLPN